MQILLISLFGMMGILLRFLLSGSPEKTLFINVFGSFLIGLVYVYATERSLMTEELRLGITVGFLGGFTTFSTFSLEFFKFWEEGRLGAALFYGVGSPVLGILACFAGVLGARYFLKGAA